MGLMALNLATLNLRGLRDSSKYARLLGELKMLRMNVTAVQESHFLSAADCRILERDLNVFSAYGTRSSAGLCLFVGRSLDADVDVFAGDGTGWLWPMWLLKVSISLWRGFPFFVGWRRSRTIRSG